MRNLTILLLTLALPGLARAAELDIRVPSVSLPNLAIPGPALSLPSPKIPVMTPAQIDAVYRLPAPALPAVSIDGGVKLPPRKPGLPGEDDLLGGVPAKLVPPRRPLAPAAAAAALPSPHEDEAKSGDSDDLMRQLERLFDKKGGCWKTPTPVPAGERQPALVR